MSNDFKNFLETFPLLVACNFGVNLALLYHVIELALFLAAIESIIWILIMICLHRSMNNSKQ